MLSVTSEKQKIQEDREYNRAYREAFLCTYFTNLYRDIKRFPKPIVSIHDFMPEYPAPAPQERTVMNDEEIEATLTKFVYPILKAAEGDQ